MRPKRLKVVVFGAENAGKSTFIHALDGDARHVEARSREGSTTVALDFGRVQVGRTMVYLFGTPGQERFEFARRLIARGMDAAILIVDATGADDSTTERLHRELMEEGVPYAIVLNKCDLADGRMEHLQRRYRNGHCYPVSALRGENVFEALHAFISGIHPAAESPLHTGDGEGWGGEGRDSGASLYGAAGPPLTPEAMEHRDRRCDRTGGQTAGWHSPLAILPAGRTLRSSPHLCRWHHSRKDMTGG